MLKCKICLKELKNKNGLSKHLRATHNKSYVEYAKIFKLITPRFCKNCGKEITYMRGINYCSYTCNSHCNLSKCNIGRKQSKQTILNRVSKIDYVALQKKKEKNMLNKYGYKNAFQVPRFRKIINYKLKGRKCPRTKAHQRKIIESKIRNGTIKHTEDTKRKIRRIVLKTVNHKDFDRSVFCSKNNNKKHKNGYIHGLYYRSSYEQAFIDFCFKENIEIVGAENKNFAVEYYDKNHNLRKYYPDFYLPEKDLVIEVSAKWSLNNKKFKIEAAKSKFKNYKIITEDELLNLNNILSSI